MADQRVCAVVDVPAGEARRFPVDGTGRRYPWPLV